MGALMWLDGACCNCLYQSLSLLTPTNSPFPMTQTHSVPTSPLTVAHMPLCASCNRWYTLFILSYSSFKNISFLFSFSSSSFLSTARLTLIRMMDGAELWLQPSPAASWELRDTEGEVEGERGGGVGSGAGGWWSGGVTDVRVCELTVLHIFF